MALALPQPAHETSRELVWTDPSAFTTGFDALVARSDELDRPDMSVAAPSPARFISSFVGRKGELDQIGNSLSAEQLAQARARAEQIDLLTRPPVSEQKPPQNPRENRT